MTPLKAAGLALAAALLGAPAGPPLPGIPFNSEQVRLDPLRLTAHLAERITHGERHDGLTHNELVQALDHGDIILTCGPAVDFIRQELGRHGIRARNVQLTAPGPTNGFDDGHILLEVETERGDVLVDVSQKRMFLIDGHPASEAEIRADGFDDVELAAFGRARIDPAFRYASYMEAISAHPRLWYGRMFAIDHDAA